MIYGLLSPRQEAYITFEQGAKCKTVLLFGSAEETKNVNAQQIKVKKVWRSERSKNAALVCIYKRIHQIG